ncbi:hypothetical protein PybrP1_005092 [[Pythium] brassicae (nom. inval.)]|nr:hypothetical protein PybrP1_005092 [[Pythium] brassicae (nom. inval.)]
MNSSDLKRKLESPSSSSASTAFALKPGDLRNLVAAAQDAAHSNARSPLQRLGGLDALARSLRVDLALGLGAAEAEILPRRQRFGANYVAPKPPTSLLALMYATAFKDPTNLLLIVVALVSLALGVGVGENPDKDWMEGACVLVAVLVIALVSALTDAQKEKQFRALNAVNDNERVQVVRGGEPVEVNKWDLVVGDVVRIGVGDILPADGLAFEASELHIDESAMTGESDFVAKGCDDAQQHAPVLLAGTRVMEGFGKMLVLCVGEHSQYGSMMTLIRGGGEAMHVGSDHVETPVATLAAQRSESREWDFVEVLTPKSDFLRDSVSNVANNDDATRHTPQEQQQHREERTPLGRKLDELNLLLGKAGIVIALTVFVAMSARFSIETFAVHETPWRAELLSEYLSFFLLAVTVLVVAIPEGLPLAVAIALAHAVRQMLRDNNLVRHLNACETAGNATTICSDKTGTLTTNSMSVARVWMHGGAPSCDKAALFPALSDVATTATMTHSEAASLSDTVKTAFCEGIAVNSTAELMNRGADTPSSSSGSKTECALLAFIGDFGGANYRAAEAVLALCTNAQHVDSRVEALAPASAASASAQAAITEFASQGFRTICLAYRDVSASAAAVGRWPDEQIECDLTCLAIVGIEDPVRPEVPGAVQACKQAGVVVRMVTGDNVLTACSIARQCGILDDAVVADTDIEAGRTVMDGPTFRSRVLDARGHLVQDEFDRVWPSLRVLARSSPADKFHLVQGLKQTRVRGEQPQLSIVRAIMWGRNVYDAIAKFLQFQLTVIAVAVVLASVGGVALQRSPITAVQILWVNLIMDAFASLALATEPPTPALLARKPYPRDRALVSRKMAKHIAGHAAFQLVLLLVLTFYGDVWFAIPSGRSGRADADASPHLTIVFNTFTWLQLFNEFNCRKVHDEQRVLSDPRLWRNRTFLGALAAQMALQVLIVEFGGDLFHCTPLSAPQWLACVGMGALSLPLGFVLRRVPEGSADE